MKIHSTHQNVSGRASSGRQTQRVLAFGGAVALCVVMCTSAAAQSLSELSGASGAAMESPNMVRNGLFTHGEEKYRVVDTAGFRTAADLGATEAGSIAQVGYSSCGSCGTSCGGTCGGYSGCDSCDSCGTGCGGTCGGGAYGGYGFGSGTGWANRQCGYEMDPCGCCVPFYYGSVEALYLRRDRERFSLSPQFRLSDYDYEVGGRVTIGAVPDSMNGYEVSFTGMSEWDRGGLANSFVGGIETILVPGGGLVAANLSAFNDANFQLQAMRSRYWSIEVNKTCMGWDIAKLLYGFRYVDFREDYSYFSRSGTESGLLLNDVKNHLIGVQVGLDLLYPLALNTYADFRSRFAGFINFAESDFTVFNAGFIQVANADDRARIAGLVELGTGLRYHLTPAFSVRVGAELWYLPGFATTTNQFTGNVITPFTGAKVENDDDFVVGGITVGGEIRF